MQRIVGRWVRRVACASVACLALAVGCGDDDDSSPGAESGSGETGGRADAGAIAGAGGRAGSGATGGVRSNSPLNCPARSTATLSCGGQSCPSDDPMQTNPCFEPCCVMSDGRERCGLRGTASAFRTECVLPGVPDDSCDEIVQFQGCCDLTQHRCGIIGGFAPGCQTKSSFVTLPKNPKMCGGGDDSGTSDGG
jgi:hypothetical protein